MKRGGGVASDDDIAPDVLADIGQGDEDAARHAVERLKAAGRVVAVTGGWSTPDWHDVQRETSSTERVRRHREKVKRAETDVTVSSCFMERDETVKRPTVHNSTVQNDDDTCVRERPEPEPVTTAASRTHAHEGPVEVAEIPHLAELVAAWWATQLGQGGRRPGFITPPAVIGAIRALLDAHGHERLKWAIGAAVAKTNQGAPTLSFLTRLCEGGPLPERPQQARGGSYQGAAYKSANGVATPAHVPEGEL